MAWVVDPGAILLNLDLATRGSPAMRSNSAIMVSICLLQDFAQLLRRPEISWRLVRPLNFIDYSPNQLEPGRRLYLDASFPIRPDCGAISLAFGFRASLAFGFQTGQDSVKTAVAVGQAGGLFLGLGQEILKRLMEPDGLIRLGAGAGPVGTEPDSSSMSSMSP